MSAVGVILLALGLSGGGQCYATARDVAAGAALAAADLTAVPCRRAGRPPLRYDVAARAPVALTALPSGTYLGPVVPGVEAQIPAGAELTLRSTAGVVTIERRVTAMQPGRSGGKVFVRDSEGKVFAVPLVLDAR